MAQSDLTGDITTDPDSRIVFSGPFDKKQRRQLQVTNCSDNRIAFVFKTSELYRFRPKPAIGIIEEKETISVTVTCMPFDYPEEDNGNDHLRIEWVNSPEKEINRDWFSEMARTDKTRKKKFKLRYY